MKEMCERRREREGERDRERERGRERERRGEREEREGERERSPILLLTEKNERIRGRGGEEIGETEREKMYVSFSLPIPEKDFFVPARFGGFFYVGGKLITEILNRATFPSSRAAFPFHHRCSIWF